MAAAAIFETHVNTLKCAITIRFWWKLVHRLRKTCWVQNSQYRKWRLNFKMAAAASTEIQVRAIKGAITTRVSWKLLYRLRKACGVQNSEKRWRTSIFKMAAVPILLIEVNAVKLEVPPDFDKIWYTDLQKHAEFKSHKSGNDRPLSRRPPPCWNFKWML
jgi:hypothetical protein